jgi:hypothetical protein
LTIEKSALFELQVTELDRDAFITKAAEGTPDEFLIEKPTLALQFLYMEFLH